VTAHIDAAGHYLRALLGKPFSDEQLAVVTAPLAPQLVVAGAGSGKTTVMAARVVHAVAFHGIAPGAVLGLTFTNKAAGELAARVRHALGTLREWRGDDPLSADADDIPTISTYHAYAAQLLADHALRMGREPDVRLLTEAGRWQLAMAVARSARGPFTHLDCMTATAAGHLLDLDGEMSEHLVDVDDVRGADARIRAMVAGAGKVTKAVQAVAEAASTRDELLSLVAAYRQRKLALDAVDFGDQVALAATVAEGHVEVGDAERARFRVVFLDEYQDTGVAQRRLLVALFGGGHAVTAVGDPCQSIYGWRGASSGNLLRFTQHFPGPGGAPVATQFLSTSYRNGRRILAAANSVSAPLRRPTTDTRRPPVDVPPLRPGPDAAEAAVRVSWHATLADEADWLADAIASLVREGTPPGEIAVLCRRRADFARFSERLLARDVPVEVVGLGGLLGMPEIVDIVAVLEVLAEPTANAALVRLLSGARWRIGPRDLAALGRRARALSGGRRPGREEADVSAALAEAAASVDPADVVALSDALDSPGNPDEFSPEAFARLARLRNELHRLRGALGQPVVDIVARIVRTIGLDVELEATPGRLRVARVANLSAFLDHAARFESVEGESDLPAFLGYLTAAADVERGLDVGAVSSADTVKLLTAHKAKGLEWDVVAVPCLSTGTFPPDRGRSRWTTAAAVLPYQLRGDCTDLPADPAMENAGIEAFRRACSDDDLTEERRLAYVAVTRARTVLLASGHAWNDTRSKPMAPAPFLHELADACRAGAGTVESWAEVDADAGNPLAAAARRDVAWPAAYDADAAAARLDAAARVLGALAGSAGPPAQLSVRERTLADSWERDTERLLQELRRDRSPERTVALPRTLTTSDVVRLAASADDFARELARPLPRRPQAAARRGTAFHAWVEHRFDPPSLFDADDLPGAVDEDSSGDDQLDALREAFAGGPYADVRPHAVEAPFEYAVAGRLVRGRIDAVYATDDGFDVVDYKTGSPPRGAAATAAALQLAVYRLAWADLAGVPPERVGAAFLYVRTGALVRPVLPGREALARLLAGDGEGPPVEGPPVEVRAVDVPPSDDEPADEPASNEPASNEPPPDPPAGAAPAARRRPEPAEDQLTLEF
jgi:DNA helicase-2/ATP-dependent DNA helicase PcrA